MLRPGWNCDPLVKAHRFALLVDGADYYYALEQSIRHARRTVIIVGWDLDSRVRLGPGAGANEDQLVPPIRDFLPAAARAKPELNIYILTWDFPFLFANVRDPKLVRARDPFAHPRVHLKFDSTHPPGASQHQKIVVVDDGLAFAGGMDIAGGRWDTSEHRAYDTRRSGKKHPYPPTHDVQAMVDGDAARALAAIVRDRWYRATGESIPDQAANPDVWPGDITPDVEDVFVGISRTDFAADATQERREVERLHLDLIAAARRLMYIENQYLTSSTIVAALCDRLRQSDGPEIVIVLPLNNAGWLEEHTIEPLRFRWMRRLREADRFQRLRICYPVVPGLDGDGVQVHSKVLIIDDQLLRVGSSNLTNRSMRLDTECDLTIEATSAAHRRGITTLRNRLLAEHLGLSVDAVEAFLTSDPSLVRLVDSRRMESRSLREVSAEAEDAEPLVDDEFIDPSRPLTPGRVIKAMATSSAIKRLLPVALIGAAMTLGLWALWRARKATSIPTTR